MMSGRNVKSQEIAGIAVDFHEVFSVAVDGEVYRIPTEQEQARDFEELSARISRHRSLGRQVAVVQGLGFVGGAVVAALADARDRLGNPLFSVIGVDLPSSYWKVSRLNKGLSPIGSPCPELIRSTHRAVVETHNLVGTVCPHAYSLADIIVVDVPLDVKDRAVTDPGRIEVGLDAFHSALRTVGRFMRPECLVIIETTVPIGTSQAHALPVLTEERQRRGIDSPVYLAYCYERVMPGPNYMDSIRNCWRTLSGINPESLERARNFYSSFINTDGYPLSELDDIAGSEMAKLLENSYRAVNIAFIYEWTLLAEKMGIDLFKVIESIRVRKGTHDNIRLPGFGVGGYCLTKDSLLAQWSSDQVCTNGFQLSMTLEALRINYNMPLHTRELLSEAVGNDLDGKTIAIMGVSYLPEVPDTRNSPTERLVDELSQLGCRIVVHDPHVSRWPERPQAELIPSLGQALEKADAVVFAVAHKMYTELDPHTLLDCLAAPAPIIDAANIISDEKAQILHDSGCQLLGVGKGHWRRIGYQCLK